MGKYYGQFASWIPNNFKYSLINVPSKGFDSKANKNVNIPMSATFVSNHTAIKDCFASFLKKFKKLYKKKAFLHWYFDEGMDEENFEEASMKISDLVTEYEERGNVEVDLDNLDGDFEPPEDEEEEDEDAILAKYTNNSNDNDGGGGYEFNENDSDEFAPPGGDEDE